MSRGFDRDGRGSGGPRAPRTLRTSELRRRAAQAADAPRALLRAGRREQDHVSGIDGDAATDKLALECDDDEAVRSNGLEDAAHTHPLEHAEL